MVVFAAVINIVITCGVLGVSTALSILEPVVGIEKPENGVVLPTPAVTTISLDESIAKRVMQGNIGPDDRKAGEKILAVADDSSGSRSRSGNKWGFNHDCQVVCRKSICIGWGPSLEEVCRRGSYKHRCCKSERNQPLGPEQNGPKLEPVRPEDIIKSGHAKVHWLGDSTGGTFDEDDLGGSTAASSLTGDKSTTTVSVENKIPEASTTVPTTVAPEARKIADIVLPEETKVSTDAPQLITIVIGSPNGSSSVPSSLLETIFIGPPTTQPTALPPTVFSTSLPTMTSMKPTPKLKAKLKSPLKKPKSSSKTNSAKLNISKDTPTKKTAVSKIKAIPNKPFRHNPKKAQSLSTKIICANLTLQPQQCIEHSKCDYSCTMKKCVTKGKKDNKRSAQEVCHSHACLLDVCPCLGCGLSYDVSQGMCAPQKEICSNLKFSEEECTRPNQFYGYAGTICKSDKISGGNCHIGETVLAVNLGTKGTSGKYVDSRNVTHLSDDGVPFEDKYKTKMKLVGLPGNRVDANAQDKVLYETIAHGDPFMEEPGRCLMYKVKLWQNGRYELSVKLADPLKDKPKERMFTIRLNGVEVMTEVDISLLTGGHSYAIELFLNFEVLKSGTSLAVKGFPNSTIKDGYVDLSFCYGRCQQISDDQDYVVAAFSVVKFADLKDPETKKCFGYSENACGSRKNACQYNVVTGETVPLRDCSKTWFTKSDCLRKNVFYLESGVLCRNRQLKGGDCKIDDIPAAVNLNGARYGPDTRGVRYHSQQDIPPIDPHHTAHPKSVENVIGVQDRDKALYTHYLYGDAPETNISGSNCISWLISLKKDGMYELSIKTGEFYYTTHGSRTFNVKVNDDIVLQEVDLLGLAPKGTAVDIILNFEVLDHRKMLHLRGYPLKYFQGTFKLEFCFGGCKTQDRNWMVGAFYVARFAHAKKKLWGL